MKSTHSYIPDAAESNAGDYYHSIWAVRKSLELLNFKPGGLKALGVESLNIKDEQNLERRSLLGIDLTEYYGGATFATSDRVVVSQVKYSTRHSAKAWSAADICRGKKVGTADSIIDRLGYFFNDFSSKNPSQIAKLSLKLVSNRPVSPDLSAALQKIKTQVGISTSATGITFLQLQKIVTTQELKILDRLKKAAGVDTQLLPLFLAALDFSDCHAGSTLDQKIKSYEAISRLGNMESRDQFAKLRELIIDRMLPANRGNNVLYKEDILFLFGFNDFTDLFPVNNKISLPANVVPRAQLSDVITLITDPAVSMICLHGAAGIGKSTLVSGLPGLLPPGSQSIVFDCYGGGAYNDSEDRRHKPEHALLHLANELALACGTSFLLLRGNNSDYYVKGLKKRMVNAVAAIQEVNPFGLLVFFIDAADNSMAAANRFHSENFITELSGMSLPQGCKVIFSSRTERLDSLLLPSKVRLFEIAPFSKPETIAYLAGFFSGTPESLADEFHRLTYATPRVMSYVMEIPGQTLAEKIGVLKPNGKTLEQLFQLRIHEATLKVSDTSIVTRFLTGLVALPAPAPETLLLNLSGLTGGQLADLRTDLWQGLIYENGSFLFRDEDLETFVRQMYPVDESAYKTVAMLLLHQAGSNEYASIHLGIFLSHAGMKSELFNIVLNRELLQVPADPIKNKEIFVERVRLAMKLATKGDLDFYKLQFIAAEAAKSNDIIENILLNHAELAAAYGNLQTNQKLYFQSGNPQWFGPVHFRNAAVFSRDRQNRQLAAAHFQKGESWLRYRENLSADEKAKFEFNSRDIAYGAEAVLRIYGPRACANYVNNWNPKAFSYQVLQDLLETLISLETNSQLNAWFRPFNLKLRPDLRIMVISLFFRNGLKVGFDWKDILARPLLFSRLSKTLPLFFQETLITYIEFAIREKAGLNEVQPFLDLITQKYSQHLPGFYNSGIDDAALIEMDLLFRVKSINKYLNGDSYTLPDFYPEGMRNAFAGKDTKEQHKYADYKSKLNRVFKHLLRIYDCRAGLLLGRVPEKATIVQVEKIVKGISDDWELRYQHEYQYQRIRKFMAMKMLDMVFHCKKQQALQFICNGFDPKKSNDIHPLLAIAESISQRPSFHEFSLKLLQQIESSVVNDMLSGSEMMDYYKRATIIASRIAKTEGKYYFDKMVLASNEIDEEAYDQIRAIRIITDGLNLNEPELAFDFARYVEYCSARLGNGEHFPWDEAINAIADIDIRTLWPVTCRWDHRNTRKTKEHFIELLHLSLRKGLMDHRMIAGLLPMNRYYGRWMLKIIQPILDGFDAEGSAPQKSAFVSSYIRDLKLHIDARSDLRIVGELLAMIDNGKFIDPQIVADFRDYYAQVKKLTGYSPEPKETVQRKHNSPLGKTISRHLKKIKIDAELNLNTLLVELRHLAENNYVPVSSVFAELRKKAKLDGAVFLLDAIAELTEDALSYHDFETILAETINEWQYLAVLKEWKPKAFLQVLRNWLPMLTSYNSIEFTSLKKLRDLFDSSDTVIANFVIDSFPARLDDLPAGVIYNLFRLTITGATVAERLALSRWIVTKWTEPIKTDFGDGVYAPHLAPPQDARTLTGGFLHYHLGHPVRALRWRTAHCIRRLIGYQQYWLIDYLLDVSKQRQIGCFQDKELTFFWMSARLYLFITLERVCREHPLELKKKAAELFTALTDQELPHAQIKYFLRSACLHLQSVDPRTFNKEEINTITHILSPLRTRRKPQEHRVRRKHQPVSDDLRFAFDTLDTIDEWYLPLAGIFGVEMDDFLHIIDRLIAESWGFTGNVHELNHVRAGGYSGTSNRHGDEPAVEDLRTYYEYHGMFCAAYELLKKQGIVKDGYYETWEEWLRSWANCWEDRWLSEFRDPIPLEPRFWEKIEVNNEWDFSVQPEDFDLRLGLPGECSMITLQEDSSIYYGKDHEKIVIMSALVDPETAPALLTAMQTNTAYQNYIPHKSIEDDDDVIGNDKKFKVGDIIDYRIHVVTGIDDRDPNFNDYSRDRLLPAKSLITGLKLRMTEDTRLSLDSRNNWVTKYEVWNNTTKEYSYGDFSTLGYRLSIKKGDLLTYLRHIGKCLIVNCHMSRDLDRRENREYYPDYCLMYLIYPDGSVNTLTRSYQIR